MTIGIAGYPRTQNNSVWRVLSMPFRRQKDYWTSPQGIRPERDDAALETDRLRLAE